MALAFVQERAGTVADGGTLAYSSAVGDTALLVAAVLVPGVGVTGSGITDTLGNTWQMAVRKVGTAVGAGAGFTVEIWYAACPTGGANTITCDWSAAANGQVSISEFSGFTEGVFVDQTGSGETDNSTPNTCGSITTTQGVAVLIGCLAFDEAFSVISRLPGWEGLTAGSRRDSQYKINTSAPETTNGEVTCTTNEDTTGAIASFYTAVTGGGGGADRRRPSRGMMMGHW